MIAPGTIAAGTRPPAASTSPARRGGRRGSLHRPVSIRPRARAGSTRARASRSRRPSRDFRCRPCPRSSRSPRAPWSPRSSATRSRTTTRSVGARQPTPWIIGFLALILSATVAITLLAIYGTGESDAGGADAVLELISIPPGAKVTVDGKVLPSPTPTEIRGAPGARFLLRFELPRYQQEEQEFVVPEQGDVHQVVARLDPSVVKLSIDSVPQGAEVFIGGNSVGRTPLELPGLDPQFDDVDRATPQGLPPGAQAARLDRQVRGAAGRRARGVAAREIAARLPRPSGGYLVSRRMRSPRFSSAT